LRPLERVIVTNGDRPSFLSVVERPKVLYVLQDQGPEAAFDRLTELIGDAFTLDPDTRAEVLGRGMRMINSESGEE
jgi:hypothetical protein